MNLEEFKDQLFKKLVEKKEVAEDDKEKFEGDFMELTDAWNIVIEIINEAVEANFPKNYTDMIERGYRNQKKKK